MGLNKLFRLQKSELETADIVFFRASIAVMCQKLVKLLLSFDHFVDILNKKLENEQKSIKLESQVFHNLWAKKSD